MIHRAIGIAASPLTKKPFARSFVKVGILDDPHAPRSDQELIAASLARDTAAFGELVARYQNRLYRSLIHVIGSPEDAQDVAQKLSSFRGDAQFYSWLFRIALNASVNYRRKNRSLGASLDATKERVGSEPSDTRTSSRPARRMPFKIFISASAGPWSTK